MDARLIVDEPAVGTWNMAVDEALQESAAETGSTCLRFYQWSEPTLSLGYFQAHSDRHHHAASAALPMVRRATGGGAIVHHHDLTYSLTTPITSRFSALADQLTNAFHTALVDALCELNLDASLSDGVAMPRDQLPFLCFQRRYAGDVVVSTGDKIAGSAQRRHRGALLQHGSVLLATSTFAPELRGLAHLGLQIGARQLRMAWTEKLAAQLDLSFTCTELTSAEFEAAHSIQSSRFNTTAWNRKR